MKFAFALVAGLLIGSLDNNATTITTGFGSIPGAAPGAYSGSGIPQDTSAWTQISGLPSPSILSGPNTVTTALAVTQHGSSNPAPGNDGINTYFVGTGLNGGRSLWNFDLYGRVDVGTLVPYSFLLTETSDRTGLSFSFNPLLIPDNVGGPSAFGNSESLDFASFGLPIGYNPLLDDTYHFTLDTSLNGHVIDSDHITVVAGNGASHVPDGGSTAMFLGAGMVGLVGIGARRKIAVIPIK